MTATGRWRYPRPNPLTPPTETAVAPCLGADWSPSGSKNLLGELKVADMWNRTDLGGHFTDLELCEMATCNSADALGWGDRLGV